MTDFLYLRKDVAQTFVQDEVGVVIIGRFVAVDEHQALAGVIPDQPGGWVDRQRGAADDQKVCRLDGLHGLCDAVLVQALLIEHNVRLDDPAAGAAGHARRVF